MQFCTLEEDLLIDIETNGIKPDTVWMIGMLEINTGEYQAYIGDDEIPMGILRMMEARTLIGHHIRRYDLYHLTRLTEGMADFSKQHVIDTLEMSRRYCNLEKHGLADWGELFDYPKLPSPPWDRFTPEMVPYCERDVRLNYKVFELLREMDVDGLCKVPKVLLG